MIHNGIEYGLMAAYAEGLNILRHANAGAGTAEHDAETTPMRQPEHYQYELQSRRDHRSVASRQRDWLVASRSDGGSAGRRSSPRAFRRPRVGFREGRWALQAANDEGVPAFVLTAALFERFASRDQDVFQNKVLSAMRFGFGGHAEKKS